MVLAPGGTGSVWDWALAVALGDGYSDRLDPPCGGPGPRRSVALSEF